MSKLSERLSQAMAATGFTTQRELETASGVSQSVISKILKGAALTSKKTGDLAAAMGVSPDWLMNGNGSMFGAGGSQLPKIDISKQVKVYDESGETGEVLSWFSSLPEHYRAYVINRSTGIAQVPAGSVIIVNPEQSCSTNDLVLAMVSGTASVFRYHISGDGRGFLSLDDSRVPIASASNSSSVIGPVLQVFIPDLTK